MSSAESDTNLQLIRKVPVLYSDAHKNILYQNLIINLQEFQIDLNARGFYIEPSNEDEYKQYFYNNESPTANEPNRIITSPKFLIPFFLKIVLNQPSSYFRLNEISYHIKKDNPKPNTVFFYLKQIYNIYLFMKENQDFHFYFWNNTFPNLFHCFSYNKALEDAKNFIIKLYEITEFENYPVLNEKIQKKDNEKYFPINIRDDILKKSVISFIMHNMNFRDSLHQLFLNFLYTEEDEYEHKTIIIHPMEALQLSFQSSLNHLAKQQIDALIFLKERIPKEEFQKLITEEILIRSVKLWRYSPYFVSNQILYDTNNCILLDELYSLINGNETTSQKIKNLSDFFDSSFDEFLKNPTYSSPNYFNRALSTEPSFPAIFTKLDIVIISIILGFSLDGIAKNVFSQPNSHSLDTGLLLTIAFEYGFFNDTETFKGKSENPDKEAAEKKTKEHLVLSLLNDYSPLQTTLRNLEATTKMTNCYNLKSYVHLKYKNEEAENDKMVSNFVQCFLNFFNNELTPHIMQLLILNFKFHEGKKREFMSALEKLKSGSMDKSFFTNYEKYLDENGKIILTEVINSSNIHSQDRLSKIDEIIEKLKKDEVKDAIANFEVQNLVSFILQTSNLVESNDDRMKAALKAYIDAFDAIDSNVPFKGQTSIYSSNDLIKQFSVFFNLFDTYAHGFLFTYFIEKKASIIFNTNTEKQIPFYTDLLDVKDDATQYNAECDNLSLISCTESFHLITKLLDSISKTVEEVSESETVFEINIGEVMMILPELNLVMKNIQSIPNLKGSYILLFIHEESPDGNKYPMILHQTLLYLRNIFNDINIDIFNDVLASINQLLDYFFTIDE
ncbi:hypothetical protein M9Y10_008274 [Tritrichomonas musculus]|uniref:VPS9 domain-containing protein n=1 Tax=Tritrichomonas musculus TaxID=1915356 RepID=A0ABR2IYG7_9EUKA